MRRGFVLGPTYRLESGRPVVLLYGMLEGGGAFLVRDTRQRPRFWIDAQDGAAAARLGAAPVAETPPRRDMRGRPVLCVEVARPQDVPPLRERLERAGVACLEADVRFAYRYLIDRGIRGAVSIVGEPQPGDGPLAVFDDPAVAPADWIPRPTVLSLDIETDPSGRRLLSVALCGAGADEVLLLSPPGRATPAGATPHATERELLAALVRRVTEIDPDVLTGWNVVDFDLTVLSGMSARLGVPLALGRVAEPVRLRPAGGARGTAQRAAVPGRVVLDGIDLVRSAFVKLESFGLDAAARAILGRGKTLGGPDRAEAILELFEHDRARFVEYNRTDARLVLEILERLQLIELAFERSRLTGIPPDRLGASVAAFDFLYLSELARRRIVAPGVSAQAAAAWAAETSGGHVLDPRPGLWRNVLVFDFKSLYPSIIRTFQIDPLGRLERPADDPDPILAPGGAAFRRAPGILPGLLDALFPRRAAAQARGDAVAAQAIKILMNSFYGVLGTPACRFAAPELANAITGFGREVLLWAKRRVEQLGYEVLYGDTDSLFVRSGLEDPAAARDLGQTLAARLNGEFAAWIGETWRVESRLELEFEALYLRLLLPALRGRAGGARKRYAGLVDEPGAAGKVVFTGLEVVRSDWTELARRVQRELYERLFSDRPIEDYLRAIVADVRRGALDDLLVYRKALRKGLAAYEASTPPHVAAARKMKARPGRVIAYVMTAGGAEPAAERRLPPDHEHYVQKQVRPVAEPVLAILGLEFDRVVGDERQGRLF